MTKPLSLLPLLLFLLLVLLPPPRAVAQDTSRPLPDMKPGDASTDPDTSRGIEMILHRCAEQYRTDNFETTGLLLSAYKTKRTGESLQQRNLYLAYKRPSHLFIQITGDGQSYTLVANETTVTKLNQVKKQIIEEAAPDSLGAYVESQRAGELLPDETGNIDESLVASLLLSENPEAWLHSNVVQYVFEGIEEVTLPGKAEPVSCWRIKFIQTDPEIVVSNWIDRDNYYLRKVAVVSAVDDDGEFVESYKDSVRARMELAIYTDISTAPIEPTNSYFTAKAYRDYQSPEPPKSPEPVRESGWTRLVRAAVATKGDPTTVSVTSLFGPGKSVRAHVLADAGERIEYLGHGKLPGQRPALVYGTGEAQVKILDRNTSEPRTIDAPYPVHTAVLLHRPETDPLVVVASATDGRVHALDLNGKVVWTYGISYLPIERLQVVARPEGDLLYIDYGASPGVKMLDTSGTVLYSSRRVKEATYIATGMVNREPMLAADVEGETYCLGPQLNVTGKFTSEDGFGIVGLDTEDPLYPLLLIGNPDEAIMLQKASCDGTTSWTRPVLPEASDAPECAVRYARLRLGDEAQPSRYLVILLSDGKMSILKPDGTLACRIHLETSSAVARREDYQVGRDLAVADFDGNGEDELYLALDAAVVRLATATAIQP